MLNSAQQFNLDVKRQQYNERGKPDRKYTSEEIVLNFLAERPNQWFFTWDFAGDTKWGFLSHATHATLRKAEQQGLILKEYVGKYVVYTHKHKEVGEPNLFNQ